MPIWLRMFTFKKLKEHYEKQNNDSPDKVVEQSIANMKSAQSQPGVIPKVNVPTYVTKASKK